MSYNEYASMYQNQYAGVDQQIMVNTTSNGTVSLNSALNSGVIFQTSSTYTQGYFPLVSDGLNNIYQQQGTYTNVPVTIEPYRMKSQWAPETGPHDHQIECRLTVKNVEVMAEYFCFHCNEVVHSKVISRLPKSIMNKKCLPRLVKGV
jgi:hypothetical protein